MEYFGFNKREGGTREGGTLDELEHNVRGQLGTLEVQF